MQQNIALIAASVTVFHFNFINLFDQMLHTLKINNFFFVSKFINFASKLFDGNAFCSMW